MDDIAIQRQLQEIEENGNHNMEDVFTSCFFTDYCQSPVSLETKKKDDRLPRSLKGACKTLILG